MKRLLYLKTLAAIVACLALALPASAYSFMKDGIYYSVNGTSASVTYKDANYNSYSGTVIIPATVTNGGTTYDVRAIGPSAFQNCSNLRRVVIPSSVEYLMNYAFQNCTGLTNITIPATVFTIYNHVFEGCTGLKSVICLNPNARPCNANNFSTTTYSRAKLIVPQGSLSAYQSATDAWGSFGSIEEMTCDFVEDAIFYNILDGNTVEVANIVRNTESYSGDIVIPQTITHDGTTYTVTAVGDGAFYYGHQLYTLELPSTVNSIGNYAFYECINLESVNIPEGVQYLNYCSFAHCRALSDITIPSSVTWIAQNCFYGCTTLSSIRCKATTPPMCVDSSCFPSEAYSNATLYVPVGSLSTYQSTSVWQNFTNISQTTFPAVFIRGDVNDDGLVNVSDAIALINALVNGNLSNINKNAADTNEDGEVNVSDAITLINYVLNDTWPEPRPIDMWYLWGNFIGSQPWGDVYGNNPVGISVLPLYPVGSFNSQGKGTLSWTGLVPRMRFTITHNLNSYDDIISEMWVVNNSTGQYCVRDMTDDDPNYSTFLLDEGYYTITLNTQTMTLTIEPYLSTTYYYESITMPGYYNDWDNKANAMDPVNEYRLGVENHDWWVDDFTITSDDYNGELKFCLYDNWFTNWGSEDFPYGQGLQNGVNIPGQSGTYTVFFNDITGQYNFIKK